MKEFRTGARESVLDNPVPIQFMIEGTEFEAVPPTSGQLTLLMASQANEDPVEIAKAMLEFVLAILGPEQYRVFEDGLKSGDIEMELTMEIVEWLTEQWSQRPTTSASASSQRSAVSTKRSTAKRPAKAKTPST